MINAITDPSRNIHKMALKRIEKSSPSFIIAVMQMETTLRCHFSPIIAEIQKLNEPTLQVSLLEKRHFHMLLIGSQAFCRGI